MHGRLPSFRSRALLACVPVLGLVMLASAGTDGNIHLWNSDTGAPFRIIETLAPSTLAIAFSPDSKEIAFSRFTENEALTGNSDLFVIPVNGGEPKQITTNKSTDSTPLYSPDGRYIAYSALLRPGLESDLTRLFLYDRKSGERINLTEPLDRSYSNP